jgi:hypothetical protein
VKLLLRLIPAVHLARPLIFVSQFPNLPPGLKELIVASFHPVAES